MPDGRVEISTGTRFGFGANWKSFVKLVDETRIGAARCSLTEALGVTDLSGRRFLDVGCGSGLFSLAAHQIGARVHSFDFDPDSVAAAAELRRRFAPGSNWVIEQGSILDAQFVARLGYFDVVYSWGVLHHTGDLWRAIDATARIVAPGGLLFISVYNDQGSESRMWRRVKQHYNASGQMMRTVLIATSAAYLGRRWPAHALARLARRWSAGRSPAEAKRPARARGMSAKHDMIDWVGGYPFEVARPEAVFAALRRLGFELRHLKTCGGGIGCNEYVFERVRSAVPPGGHQLRESRPEQPDLAPADEEIARPRAGHLHEPHDLHDREQGIGHAGGS
jgi:2-polyprenyl-3-methyl-5-hydroxy-6-metoxy-1,4-benzoquinol methylase